MKVVYYGLLAALIVAVFASRGRGAEFVVVNKTSPSFTVVNKTAPVDDTPTDLTKPAPPGWEKVSIDGGPWHFRKIAPGVAAPSGGTFRGGWHESHNCPSCGRAEFVVDSFNADGSHNHRCRYDNTVWFHK